MPSKVEYRQATIHVYAAEIYSDNSMFSDGKELQYSDVGYSSDYPTSTPNENYEVIPLEEYAQNIIEHLNSVGWYLDPVHEGNFEYTSLETILIDNGEMYVLLDY